MDNNPKENKERNNEESLSQKPKVKRFGLFLAILKYTFITSLVLGVLGVVAYLTLANLAFFGVLPNKIIEKMPVVNRIVEDIEAKERRIQLAKELQEDAGKIQKAGEFQIELLEEQDIDGREFVPFLYKLRVVRNRINNKELAEIWVDNVLVITFYVGIGDNTPYARATHVVRRINNLLNDKVDFNKLLPVIDGEVHKAQIMEEELFRVSQEDAIFNNSTQIELLYSWVNNLRVALGASLFQVPKFLVEERDIPKPEKKDAEQPLAQPAPPSPAAPPQTAQPATQQPPGVIEEQPPEEIEEEKLREKQLKSVVKVYERMPDDKVAEILNKMKQDEIADILRYLSVKKIAKVFPLMPAYKDVGVYRRIISEGDAEDNLRMFKKFSQVWERMKEDQLIVIFNRMTIDEKIAIFRRMSDKKKAKVFDSLSVQEAKRYLQLLEVPPES